MSIQNPILAAGPTLSRAQVETVVARLSGTLPPDAIIDVVDGSIVSISQSAVTEGEIALVESDDGRSVSMYVVVTVMIAQSDTSAGTPDLQWRKITRTGTVTDPRSGKPKDPLFDFYSGLS